MKHGQTQHGAPTKSKVLTEEEKQQRADKKKADLVKSLRVEKEEEQEPVKTLKQRVLEDLEASDMPDDIKERAVAELTAMKTPEYPAMIELMGTPLQALFSLDDFWRKINQYLYEQNETSTENDRDQVNP